jgi:hypothetical protein
MNTSVENQRQRIIAALREVGDQGLTTIQLRENYDVMMPGARIYELRHSYGFNILLAWSHDITAQGNKHLVGRYILHPGKWKEAEA